MGPVPSARRGVILRIEYPRIRGANPVAVLASPKSKNDERVAVFGLGAISLRKVL